MPAADGSPRAEHAAEQVMAALDPPHPAPEVLTGGMPSIEVGKLGASRVEGGSCASEGCCRGVHATTVGRAPNRAITAG